MNKFILIALFLIIPKSTMSKSICFTIPAGTEYCVKLLEYGQINNQMRALIEVDPETWESIDLIMLFNLRWDSRNEGSISGEKKVQIEIFLDKELYNELNKSGNLLVDESLFLNSENTHPMRSAMKWFGTEVTEEVELPGQLKDLGDLREGFTTKWKDDFKP